MNYKHASVNLSFEKDKFGRGYTYNVILSDGTNKEILYHGGNDKKAFEIERVAKNNLKKINQ